MEASQYLSSPLQGHVAGGKSRGFLHSLVTEIWCISYMQPNSVGDHCWFPVASVRHSTLLSFCWSYSQENLQCWVSFLSSQTVIRVICDVLGSRNWSVKFYHLSCKVQSSLTLMSTIKKSEPEGLNNVCRKWWLSGSRAFICGNRASTPVNGNRTVRVHRLERLCSRSQSGGFHPSLPQTQWDSPECMFIKAMIQSHLLLSWTLAPYLWVMSSEPPWGQFFFLTLSRRVYSLWWLRGLLLLFPKLQSPSHYCGGKIIYKEISQSGKNGNKHLSCYLEPPGAGHVWRAFAPSTAHVLLIWNINIHTRSALGVTVEWKTILRL